jgi:hypothetical protein
MLSARKRKISSASSKKEDFGILIYFLIKIVRKTVNLMVTILSKAAFQSENYRYLIKDVFFLSNLHDFTKSITLPSIYLSYIACI